MLRILVVIGSTFIAALAWVAFTFLGASEGWGRNAITNSDTSDAFIGAVSKKVEETHTGNFGLILIENGNASDSYFSSDGQAIDENSVFQVASLSKWLTAWGVMALVEDGQLDLDAPVSDYLKRWQLPASEFDTQGVTIRRLLSHTSGLGDGLGYNGFDTAADRQSLAESLAKATDASPGKSGRVALSAEPGSGWKYSGGGYTLLQMIIEDVTGQSFADFMTERVFQPLGMTRTSFDHETAIGFGLAENYTLTGETEAFRWYTALAPTALFSTPADIARFLQAQSPAAAPVVLSKTAQSDMRKPHASQLGADIWGLGVMLLAPDGAGGYIIGHDGNNEPAINTAARLNPLTGDGIVVFETGSELLATQIASEWVFWNTGKVDNLLFVMELGDTLARMLIGVGAILILGIILLWRPWHRKSAKA